MTTIKRRAKAHDPEELLRVPELVPRPRGSEWTIRDWIFKAFLPQPIKLGTGRSAPDPVLSLRRAGMAGCVQDAVMNPGVWFVVFSRAKARR